MSETKTTCAHVWQEAITVLVFKPHAETLAVHYCVWCGSEGWRDVTGTVSLAAVPWPPIWRLVN